MSDWITKDIWWKSFSLVLAVVIWLTVYKIREEPVLAPTAAGVSLTYGSLPVQVVSTMADVHDFRVLPGTVAVTLSGSPDVIGVLQANKIHPIVNLTNVGSARTLKRPVEVSMPPGVTLVNVKPAEVEVLFPPKVEGNR